MMRSIALPLALGFGCASDEVSGCRGNTRYRAECSSDPVGDIIRESGDPSGSLSNLRLEIPLSVVALRAA